MNDVGTIDISTESDAWLLLENTLAGKIPIDADIFHLNIGSWPVFHLKVDGGKFQSSIGTKMMMAFIDLQANIYRTYAKMQHDVANGRLLSNEEKSALELMVEVNKGSSEYKALLADIGKKIVEGAIPKMEGKHFVILGMTAILSWSSSSVIKEYLVGQTDHKKMELQLSLSKEETRRLELMKEASKQVPYVGVNTVLTEEFINKIFKGALTANYITIGGQTFNKKQVSELVRSERSTSEEVRLDGEYRILKVDSSKINFFKVELQDTTGKRFWAILQDATVTKENNQAYLQKAEWSKQPIKLMVNGTKVKGEISTAFILDVNDDRYLSKLP